MKKTVFITGGLTGMGRELSKFYLRDNYQVGICSIEKLEDIKDQLIAGVDYYQANVCDVEAMNSCITDFAKRHGRLDVVIANAGINHHKTSIPDFNRGRAVIQTNVIGVVNTFEPAINIMKEQGYGHIAGMASISSFAGLPGMACYGASKAAVLSLCESLSIDLKQYGIKVTTFAPGFVQTPLTSINKHKMPFLLKPEQAAEKMYGALKRGKSLYIFPLPMKFIAGVLKHLPRKLYRAIMAKNARSLRAN